MSNATGGSSGPGLALVVAIAAFGVGGASGWWFGEERIDLAALEQEMSAALRTVDPVVRRAALLDVLVQANPRTIPAIHSGLEREFQFADSCVIPPFASAWGRFDPVGAFESATRTWRNARKRSEAAREIVYELARTDRVDRARVLASQLSVSRVSFPTWAGLAKGILHAGDVDAATTLLLERNPGSDNNRIIEEFLQYFLLHQDVDGLKRWVEALPSDPPGIKRAAFGLATRWLSSIDPERSAQWAEAQPEDSEWLGLAHIGIAEEWIEHDPEAAMTWILGQTDPENRERAHRRVLSRFIRHDPEGASAWMSRQEPLEDAEVSIGLLVQALRSDRPALALEWASRMENPERRDELIANVAGEWMASEPAAARAWVAKNELPETMRQRIEARRLEAAEGASR